MIDLPDQPWFSIKETVFYLGVSRMTVYRMIQRGELQACGLPFLRRIAKAELQRKLSQLSQVYQVSQPSA